jgi:hypothetical protein
MGQIKQIMMANIDAVYLHCVHDFGKQRLNFFKAFNQLRREGWDVPKIAPFLDPFYLWRDKPIDVGTRAGKDELVRHYIRFFEDYLSQNDDRLAPTDLLHIDGKLVLSSWWAFSMLKNLECLTREDIESRLSGRLGNRMPTLRNGIYMMSTALIDPDYTFSDERMIMFSGYCYALHCVHKGIDVWHVQAGYWDQNIRKPGFLLSRDGGKNYRSAWEIVPSNLPYVHRVYVESWNEYDEGSGIYAADPGPPLVNESMHSNTDVFSTNNDPFEYINITAHGAARINGRPEDAAVILGLNSPAFVPVGSGAEIQVVVRNDGNSRWTGATGYGLRVGYDRILLIDDRANEIPLYRGIFRGRPLTFRVTLPVGDRPGRFITEISMAKDGVPFGETKSVQIDVR